MILVMIRRVSSPFNIINITENLFQVRYYFSVNLLFNISEVQCILNLTKLYTKISFCNIFQFFGFVLLLYQ